MVSDAAYELCLPVLDDDKLEEEEKTEKLEEILRKETSLTGRPLQEAILRILWRYRDVKEPPATSPPPHNRTARQSSPAPWQSSRATTPLASPPLTGTGSSGYPFGVAPPSFTRSRSYIGSPFESPRPSPSLAVATPLPHSPNLNSYEFSDPMASQADYGDYGSDAVDWLVNDDSPSRPSSSGAGSAYESNLNASAMAWVQPQQTEMSPYDMLRSVLGDGKSDEEIEAALEVNGYDLSATLMQLMEPGTMDDTSNAPNEGGQVLIGKSMLTSQPISITQGTPPKSSVICKYWLSTGSCLRADCRFSHDLSSHVCK
ncbi:hypothetical protein MMC25_000185 [Agyrium rufum]|nr:hypothetical protein [Agyrium rufum]